MSQTSPRGHGRLARVWYAVVTGPGSGSHLLDSSWQSFGGAHVEGLGLSHGAQRPGMLAVARAMTRASCGGKRRAQAGPKLPLDP